MSLTQTNTPIIGCGAYPWAQKHGVSAQRLDPFLDEIFTQLATAGLNAWEPFIDDPGPIARLVERMQPHGLSLVSAYDNLCLHEGDTDAVIDRAVRQCAAAREHGLRYFLCNPTPIDWNNPVDKDDAQLRRQGRNLQKLGAALRAEGISLAYHMHTTELRAAARELHHMMLATDPRDVGMCLDTHWIYRGAGNSHVALEDIVKLYASRVVTLHLRQSRNGVWHDTLEEGDIDHAWLGRILRDAGFSGPCILEMAIEEGTPDLRDWTERHRIARAYVEGVLLA